MTESFYEEPDRVFDQFPKCHIKNMLEDFSENVDREDIFKPPNGNENFRVTTNGNVVRVMDLPRQKI